MDRLIETARQRESRALQSLVILAALTLVVGAAMTIHARRVLRPLAQVTERANAVAAGDLEPRPVVATSDEIGELAAKFEWMVGAIAKANHDRLQSERLAVVGRMAAHVTHEIRNPLSSIGLNLELLEEELLEGELSGESRQLLQAIRKEVDHLSSLSEQYLSLARPQKPRLVRDSLGDLVTEVTDFLAPELKKAGVALVVEVQEQLPEALLDEAQLRQALNNLIRNAREAMQPSGRLLVKVAALGESLVLTIEDSGVGIPEEIRASVFDAFFTTKNRGTGLGLAITRQIVEAHRGTIGCEAVEPHGTRFVIRIPVAVGAPAEQV
jgi:signal transduction histidine kinase